MDDSVRSEFLAFERRLLSLPMSSQAGLLTLRLLMAAALFLETVFTPIPSASAWRWVRVLPFLYFAGAWLVYWLRRTERISNRLGTALFVMDLLTCLVVLFSIEGLSNPVYTTLLLLILSACLLQRPTLVLSVSAIATVIYGLVVFPPLPISADNMQVFYQRLTLFFLITLFSVHIADYAGQIERETARRYEERLAWMQRLSMVGKAMAAVLHEAKTPLATIVLNAESAETTLKRGGTPQDELDIIAQEADHATAVLQNFLDFVKPTRLDLEKLELAEPLKHAAGMIRVRLDERGVKLDLKTIEPCVVRASARHLVQAFSNLFNNAVDAMPSGGTLLVWMAKEDGQVHVHFQDTGIGISKERLETLFEPFSTTKAGEEGHGLGLSIVRWILQEHGGDITVQSPGQGQGTHVTLVMPLFTESFVAKS